MGGILKLSRSSSSRALLYVVSDTLFSVSRPTISAVLNVALLGLPDIVPVSLSTYSTVILYAFDKEIAVIIP